MRGELQDFMSKVFRSWRGANEVDVRVLRGDSGARAFHLCKLLWKPLILGKWGGHTMILHALRDGGFCWGEGNCVLAKAGCLLQMSVHLSGADVVCQQQAWVWGTWTVLNCLGLIWDNAPAHLYDKYTAKIAVCVLLYIFNVVQAKGKLVTSKLYTLHTAQGSACCRKSSTDALKLNKCWLH